MKRKTAPTKAERKGPKRAGIYTRVSTDEQAKKGYSLPTQLEACRKYAESHGFAVAANFADDCSGSIPIPDRPEGKKLYALVDRGEFDAVIIFTHDRTARDEGMVGYALFKDYLHQHDVELHFSDTGLDPHTLEAGLIGNIKAYLAAAERQKIRERSTRGRIAKAHDNRPVMSGTPPYGYRREGTGKEAKLIAYEPELKIVNLMYEWYLQGANGDGPLSLRAISLKLNSMGVLPPHNRGRVNRQWVPSTILRILTNEIYSGRTHYGKQRIVDGQRLNQGRGEWISIEVPHLAVVGEEAFRGAQARAKRNIELSRRRAKREYLLSGFFRCGACNSAMAGAASGKHAPVYHCGNQYRAAGKCPQATMTISAEKVESLAWEWLADLLQDEKKLDKGLRAMEQQAENEIAPKQERLEQIKRLQAEAEAKVRRLVSRIGDEADETIAASYKTELKQSAGQIEAYKEEAQSLEQGLTKTQITPERKDHIKRQAREVRKRMANPTFAQKRSLLDAVNFRASFRTDGKGKRWLDVKCGLSPKGNSLGLQPSSGRRRCRQPPGR